MNLVAGIMMGWANETWPARILSPFIWGFVWCWWVYATGRMVPMQFNKGSYGEGHGMHPMLTRIGVEYFTGSTTALIGSVIGGSAHWIWG